MKKLFLLRHGEAGTSPNGQDKTRPLTPKGAADTLALGPVMQSRHDVPDLVLCSTATRTQQTCKNLLQGFNHDITVQMHNGLYNAPRALILDAIQSVDDAYHAVLVIGHNPGINELAVTMAVHGATTLMNRLLGSGFMPGTFCALECPCGEWNMVQPGEATLIDYLAPLDYNSPSTPARWT